MILCFYSFGRYPSVITCPESNFICDCVDQLQFRNYIGLCASINATSAHNASFNVSFASDEDAMFDGIDAAGIIIILTSFIGAVATIYCAFAYTKYRRKGKAIEKYKEDINYITQSFHAKFKEMTAKIMEAAGEDQRIGGEVSLLLPYKVPASHITMNERIGSGAFGEVWLGACNGKNVAIKMMFMKNDVDADAVEMFRKECTMMARLQRNGVSHPHIAQMVYCCWENGLFLVLDYYPLGALRDVVEVAKVNPNTFGEPLTFSREGVLSKLFSQVCDAMIFLHKNEPPILHGDLKPTIYSSTQSAPIPPLCGTHAYATLVYLRINLLKAVMIGTITGWKTKTLLAARCIIPRQSSSRARVGDLPLMRMPLA